MSLRKLLWFVALFASLIGNGVTWAMPLIEAHEIDHPITFEQAWGSSDDIDLGCHHFCHAGAHNTSLLSPVMVFMSQGRDEAPIVLPWALSTASPEPATPPPNLS